MPNRKVMEAAAERRREMRPRAERAYREHGSRARELIRQLASPTQADHDQARDLLREMGELVTPELLDGLADPTLEPLATDEVISLLGLTGDERAREPIWQFLQDNQDNQERLHTAALSLAGLGDDRALTYLRDGLDSDDEEMVANSAAGMIIVGELEDVKRLREVHRRHRGNREIRTVIADAVLTILGETDQRTFERTMDEIRTSFTDRRLWADIWAILDSRFGTGNHPVH